MNGIKGRSQCAFMPAFGHVFDLSTGYPGDCSASYPGRAGRGKKGGRPLYTQETGEDVLGAITDWTDIQVRPAPSASEGIQQAVKVGNYNLLMIGAGWEVFSYRTIFGTLIDILIETDDCSVLIVRHYQPDAVLWLNKRIHQLEA